ncbi:MAG: hypothetical protein CMO74_06640 [Verrucomicrobiales bacterium]|nr:hypothetical protein [Verrucomicrobiales bacterium]
MAAVYFALRPLTPGVVMAHDKLGHGGVFLVLAALLDAARRTEFDWRAAVLLAVAGLAVECLQLLQPSRMFDAADVLANCAGIGLYWVFALIFKRLAASGDENVEDGLGVKPNGDDGKGEQ